MTHPLLPTGLLEQLRGFSTCVVASAIEPFHTRLPNVGFADSRVRCMFPDLPAVIGYAATARVRSATPPMQGGGYYARSDWWKAIRELPAPRIVVLQDEDQPPGLGAFVGEVHANALAALQCVGLVTNGGVRDLPQVRAIPFPLFAGNVAVSHAFAHISGFGRPVEVGGLEIHPGDLLMADLHGVISIPLELAARIPQVAQEILTLRRTMVEQCRSRDFTIEKLHEVSEACDCIEHLGHAQEHLIDKLTPKRSAS